MPDTSIENQPDEQPDESLGLEQLPQSELEASPGSENQPAVDLTDASIPGNATAPPASSPSSSETQENHT